MKTRRKQTKRLAVSAILAALGVVILYLGALLNVLDLSVSVIASFLCVLAVLEMGGAWPWMIYLVISILSLLLLPQKSPAVFFVVFAGYYPILKAYYEHLPLVPSWILKLVNFNLALVVLFFGALLFVTLPELQPLYYVSGLAVGNAVFIIYDLALTRVISTYLRVFRERLGIRNW